MHLSSSEDTRPLEGVEELHQYFELACKPRDDWRVGTEFELMGVYADPERFPGAPPYQGSTGIRALLEWLMEHRGWSAIRENDYIIALAQGSTQITFEPGGQLELAARPVAHADELKLDIEQFLDQLSEPSKRFGIAWLALGFRPFGSREEVPWMPKKRYEIMRAYMPQVGSLGLEMMQRTGTVQVNLDFSDADDAREKMRAAMSVTSLLTAVYANSPIVDGRESGYQSYRGHIWSDTDRYRCGLLDFVFDGVDVFQAYIDWALDVPMYFVYRHGHYHPATHMTFRQFMAEGFQGERATLDDWATHLSTLFPEARLKKYMEIRGCDCGPEDMILSLGPLCRGLLYDRDARRAAIALTASLDRAERRTLMHDVARDGMRARVKGHSVRDLARELLAIAKSGLERQMPGEVQYLEPLHAIVDSGRSRADAILDIWRQSRGDARALMEHTAVLPAGEGAAERSLAGR